MKVLVDLELFGGKMDYNKRAEIEEKYTWDLKDFYLNDDAWEKDYDNLKEEIKIISKYEGKVLSSSDYLSNTLNDYYDLITKISNLYIYASLKHDEDLGNDKYALYFNKAYSLYSDFISLSSFITPEILKASKTALNEYLKEERFKKYIFLLEEITRYKDHTLNTNEERLISKLTANSSVFDKLSSTLLNSTLNYGEIEIDGNKVTITNSNYRNIMTNKNRDVRRKCYELMSSKIKEFSNIFGDLLIANMKETSTYAEIKNYASTMEMELFTSNIPTKVLDNLYETVNKRIDIYQKYLRFLKNNLGLEKLEYYDLSAEYLNSNLTFTVEDAKKLIIDATKIYGNKYNEIIKKAFEDRWVDFGSYKGKKSGAYCTAVYGKHPVVLTNFHNKFEDVSAVAHELGHAVNFYLSITNNNSHDYENDIFVAEVASLTNEIILSNYILNNTDNKELKLQVIANLIDIIQNNLFDACLEGELENKIYALVDKKEEIDANILSDTIYDLRKKYYGNEVNLDENIKYLWARRSHYYSPFYLYQYATGVSSAVNVALNILNGNEEFKNKYIEFLSKGSTDYPINLLKDLGIDMTNTDVINKAIDYFDYLLDLYSKVSDE